LSPVWLTHVTVIIITDLFLVGQKFLVTNKVTNKNQKRKN